MLVIVLQPPIADAYVYGILTLAVLMGGIILLANARSTTGSLSVRWYLFTLGFASLSANYFRGMIELATNREFADLHVVLVAITGTSFILALTLPFGVRSVQQRALDVSIAIAFCALRIIYLRGVYAPSSTLQTLSRTGVMYGIELILALVALTLAPPEDLKFFRGAAVFALGVSLSIGCNQFGYILLHTHRNTPWMLTDTVARVAAAIYFLHGRITNDASMEIRRRNPALGSVIPFAMTGLVVWLSVILLPTHPILGETGIAFGVVGFFARIALSARHQDDTILEGAAVPQAARDFIPEVAADPLYGVEDRAGLERVLTRLTSSVSPRNCLALILFAVDEDGSLCSRLAEDNQLVVIARALSSWNGTGTTIYYLGGGRFVMLLPATPLRIAMSLAEQICLSIDTLHLKGETGFLGLVAGVATSRDPSSVPTLLENASRALDRAHIRQAFGASEQIHGGDSVFDA